MPPEVEESGQEQGETGIKKAGGEGGIHAALADDVFEPDWERQDRVSFVDKLSSNILEAKDAVVGYTGGAANADVPEDFVVTGSNGD